jgi:hypothetical protein
MNAPEGDSPTFVHRAVRWMAMLTLAYGLLGAVGMAIALRYESYWSISWWFRGNRAASLAYIALVGCLIAVQVVGALELLRWKSRGRTLLIAWAISAMLITFVSTVASIYAFVRQAAATTQPSYQGAIGYFVWSWFQYWIKESSLPLILLFLLMQRDVKKIWPARQGGGGFDVIPMAATASQQS